MADHEHRIRECAFHLWERAGRPDHRSDEFWKQAELEISHEMAASPDDKKREKAAKKAAKEIKDAAPKPKKASGAKSRK